ncbi:HAMP domain-containing protein [Halanaerobaculum tunisiense]
MLATDTLEGLMIDQGQQRATFAARRIKNRLQEQKQELKVYAHTPVIQTEDWLQRRDYLQQELATRAQEYDSFFIADQQGDYSTTRLGRVGTMQDKKYFIQAKQGQTYLSQPTLSPLTEEPIMIITTPLQNKQQEIIGVLGAITKLDEFADYVSQFKMDYFDSYSYIIDSQGQIIAHPDKSLILSENIYQPSNKIDSKLATAVKDQSAGVITYSTENSTSYIFYQTIPGIRDWKLMLEIPGDYLNQPLIVVNKRLWLIGVVAIIVVILLSSVGAKQIADPISRLQEKFAQAAKGDLTVRADIDSADEFGAMADSFNYMMDKINQLTHKDLLTDLLNLSHFQDSLSLDLKK